MVAPGSLGRRAWAGSVAASLPTPHRNPCNLAQGAGPLLQAFSVYTSRVTATRATTRDPKRQDALDSIIQLTASVLATHLVLQVGLTAGVRVLPACLLPASLPVLSTPLPPLLHQRFGLGTLGSVGSVRLGLGALVGLAGHSADPALRRHLAGTWVQGRNTDVRHAADRLLGQLFQEFPALQFKPDVLRSLLRAAADEDANVEVGAHHSMGTVALHVGCCWVLLACLRHPQKAW